MNSRSARVAAERPFYDAHADLYDSLISDPVDPWVSAVIDRLRSSGSRRTISVLDIGCGTGRHAEALIARGMTVSLFDASPSLLRIASRRCPEAAAYVDDICAPRLRERFDAVTCRGVLNDLVTDEERDAALHALAGFLGAGGRLILDVREAEAALARADGTARVTEVDLSDGGEFSFTSRPTSHDGFIDVAERYELRSASGQTIVREYHFTMRPWTREELSLGLTAAGFDAMSIERGVGRKTPDRLFIDAKRGT